MTQKALTRNLPTVQVSAVGGKSLTVPSQPKASTTTGLRLKSVSLNLPKEVGYGYADQQFIIHQNEDQWSFFDQRLFRVYYTKNAGKTWNYSQYTLSSALLPSNAYAWSGYGQIWGYPTPVFQSNDYTIWVPGDGGGSLTTNVILVFKWSDLSLTKVTLSNKMTDGTVGGLSFHPSKGWMLLQSGSTTFYYWTCPASSDPTSSGNWTRGTLPTQPNPYISCAYVDANNYYFATYFGNGIYSSSDGVNWTLRASQEAFYRAYRLAPATKDNIFPCVILTNNSTTTDFKFGTGASVSSWNERTTTTTTMGTTNDQSYGYSTNGINGMVYNGKIYMLDTSQRVDVAGKRVADWQYLQFTTTGTYESKGTILGRTGLSGCALYGAQYFIAYPLENGKRVLFIIQGSTNNMRAFEMEA